MIRHSTRKYVTSEVSSQVSLVYKMNSEAIFFFFLLREAFFSVG